MSSENPSGLRKEVALFDHQRRAADRIVDNGSLLLSHGTGSGKTLSALAAFEKMRDKGRASKALIVTPASLRANFVDNGVRKFTTGSVAMLGNQQEASQGVARAVDNPDPRARYHVVSYEMFSKDPESVIKGTGADTVIYDELHRIRNESGKTFKKIKEVRPLHRNFIGLTGSLMNNTPADLVPLVDAMTDGKHRLGSKSAFENRFVSEDSRGRQRITNARIVRSLLRPFVDHFETKELGEGRTPEKIVQEVKVMMSPRQTELYRYAIGKLDPVTQLKLRLGVSKLKKSEVQTIFSKITQARQVSNGIHTIDQGVSLSDSAKETPKVKKLLDDVEEHLTETEDGQVVVHSNLIQGGADVLTQGLKDRDISHGLFLGKGQPGVSEASRQKAVEDFNKRKNRVIVISAAGGEGLDLKDATMFASLDGHFNPEKVQQAEARAVRAGGQAHRAPEDRKVIVRRYSNVVPISKTQVVKDTFKLLSPFQMIGRALEGAPVVYNPFNRESSTDEWMSSIANRKDKLNEEFRHQLKTSALVGDPVFLDVEQLMDAACNDLEKTATLMAFQDEMEKLASAQKLPFQPYKYVKSDRHVMNAYWNALGDDIEKAEDENKPLSEANQLKEQKYVDALRKYYRAAAKAKGGIFMVKPTTTDRDIKKGVAKAALGMGTVTALSGTAKLLPAMLAVEREHARRGGAPIGRSALRYAPAVAAGFFGLGALLGGGGALWGAIKEPNFTTPKTKARKASRFSDEQLVELLRGRPITEEKVKKTEMFI